MTSDNPVATIHEDLLGRAGLAQSLAGMILDTPAGASFRIGVYGHWGEGKTSVLRMMQQILEPQGVKCVWVFPWAARTADQISTEVLDQVTGAIADKAGGGRLARLGLKKARNGIPEIDDWRLKLARYAVKLTADRLGKAQDKQVLERVRLALESHRVVIFVDDLDRTRPELIPELLLTLREALDLPNLFYVMALSPAIVEQGLRAIHPGWADQPQGFLEKIVEYPQYLSPVSGDDVARLITSQVTEEDSIDLAALQRITPYLGRNPRQLKLFLRYLQSLRGTLSRFSPEEVDLPRLYVAILLRLEFPEEAHRLGLDKKVVTKMEYSEVAEKVGRRKGGESDSLPEEPYAPKLGRERFLELTKGLRKDSFRGSYSLLEMLRFIEEPPVFTWHEVQRAFDAYVDAESANKVEVLLHEISRDGTLVMDRARTFFSMLLEGRNRILGQVADEDREEKVHSGLVELQSATAMLRDLAVTLGLFRDGILGAEEWLQMVRHLRKWAAWTRPEYYQPIRAEELSFLHATAGCLLAETRIAVRDSITQSFGWRDGRIEPFDNELDSILDSFTLDIVKSIEHRFEQPGGIEVYWTDRTPAQAEKMLLFSIEGVEDPALRSKVEELAMRADSNGLIQENFTTYFRMLSHGAFESSSLLPSQCQGILTNGSYVGIVWTAAVASPLNLRTMGSLRRWRTQIISDLRVPEEHLSLPGWWRNMERYFGSDD